MGSHCGVFSTWLQTPEYWSPKCADLLRSDHWQYNIIKRCDSDREHPQLLWGFDWDLTYQTKGCWSIVILIWFCLNYQSTARVMVRGWSTIGRPFEDRIWLLKIKVFIRLVTWCAFGNWNCSRITWSDSWTTSGNFSHCQFTECIWCVRYHQNCGKQVLIQIR